jgi:hypothetical protein
MLIFCGEKTQEVGDQEGRKMTLIQNGSKGVPRLNLQNFAMKK